MVGRPRLNSIRERNLSRISISIDEELAERFVDECTNNFIEDKLFVIPLRNIKIMGSGTTKRGAYCSEILRKLILEFLRSRDKEFADNYLKKEIRKNGKNIKN